MPAPTRPNFIVQAGSLWASGDTSYFTGTGGPAAYDPYLGLFSKTVSAAGLAATPFSDHLYNVDAGDQVVFVIAAVNYGDVAYDLQLRNPAPPGFLIPTDASAITVTDGTGAALDYTGDLFDPAGGLTLTNPVAAYDPNSGSNVVLVTVTVQASNSILTPNASITDVGQIVNYAATSGGPNLAPSNATTLLGYTPLDTNTITITTSASPFLTLLGSGQTASYDITVTLPEGTVQDLRIDQAVPVTGVSGFQLVSAQIVQFGTNLSASAPVAVQPNGSIALGNVVDTPDNVVTSADQIVVRLTVADGGSGAGTGTLNTVVSAADPNHPGQRWSSMVTNTLALAQPDTAPTISGVSPSQLTVSTTPVLPFATVRLTDPDIGQIETMTVHVTDPTLGHLTTLAGLALNGGSDVVLTGTVDIVQAALRAIAFTPTAGMTGAETFGLTLNDGIYTATDTSTTVTLTAADHPSDLVHFPISPQTVLTSTPTGSSTFAQVETYSGPLDTIQSQFLYEGAAPLAIVAQQPNMLVSSEAAATAVQLQGGVNTLNMVQGSSFIVSGTGADTIILHADQPQVTWNTIANFHAGDSVTIYGYKSGVSSGAWVANAGAAGWTGATLHMDLDGNQTIDSSVTFTGKSVGQATAFSYQTGNVAGHDYLLITPT